MSLRPLAAAVLALALAVPAAAGPAEDVEARVKTTVDRVLDLLRDKSLGKAERRRKVLEEIEPLLDLKLMAKLTLGREHWGKLSEAERGTFTDLFVEQLKGSYFEKIDLYTDETVEYGKAEEVKGGKWSLQTRIITKDQPVEMVYKVYGAEGGGWRVYDLEIEGVSLVRSYGSQYADVLRNGTPADLLQSMRAKLDAAKPAPAPSAPKK